MKAKIKFYLEYEKMFLSAFVLIASDTSLLEHGLRRWVKTLMFFGRVEGKAGSTRISYMLKSSLLPGNRVL